MSSETEKALDEVAMDIGRGIPTDPWIKPGQVRWVEDTPHTPLAVGDLESDERGSAARMNADKLAVEMIPAKIWAAIFRGSRGLRDLELVTCVEDLALFQEGKLPGDQLLNNVPMSWIESAVDVFEYGARKYMEWNWLKGQPWSVPLASAIRHAKAIFEGEKFDPESGLPHAGHFVCNLIMLATFYYTYPEGNDFPGKKFFEAEK